MGGGEGVYFCCLENTGVGRKSYKTDGAVSTLLSGVVAQNTNILIVESFEFCFVIKLCRQPSGEL